MDWTDVHFRQLCRILSRKVWLWTEMVVANTITHTDNLDKHLWFPQEQHPIVLQVGGSDPAVLREAATKAAAYGYDEINLNCGCPSDRVAGAGCFGAAMMLQPMLVAQCVQVRAPLCCLASSKPSTAAQFSVSRPRRNACFIFWLLLHAEHSGLHILRHNKYRIRL
jgi:hypothetical protein